MSEKLSRSSQKAAMRSTAIQASTCHEVLSHFAAVVALPCPCLQSCAYTPFIPSSSWWFPISTTFDVTRCSEYSRQTCLNPLCRCYNVPDSAAARLHPGSERGRWICFHVSRIASSYQVAYPSAADDGDLVGLLDGREAVSNNLLPHEHVGCLGSNKVDVCQVLADHRPMGVYAATRLLHGW